MFADAWIAFGVLVAMISVERVLAATVLGGLIKYYDLNDKH